MPDLWYPMTALPDLRVVIRVWWTAFGVPRKLDVARTWVRSSKSWAWTAYEPCEDGGEGRLYAVPPRGRDRPHWAPEPICWQPRDDAWIWPGDEPEPLPPHQVPQLTGVRYTSSEVDAAELAEGSREAERDREDAQYRSERGGKTETIDKWWADVSNIRYQPKGEIAPRMAEGRVLRALAWCGAGQGLTLETMPMSSILARMAEAASLEARAAKQTEIADKRGRYVPFKPLPQDHGDFLIAMGWVAALNSPDNWRDQRKAWGLNRTQRVMLFRALTVPLSWAEIGSVLEVSGTRCQQIYARGMEACWRVANGGEAIPGRKPVDRMAALKVRNREFKMGERA